MVLLYNVLIGTNLSWRLDLKIYKIQNSYLFHALGCIISRKMSTLIGWKVVLNMMPLQNKSAVRFLMMLIKISIIQIVKMNLQTVNLSGKWRCIIVMKCSIHNILTKSQLKKNQNQHSSKILCFRMQLNQSFKISSSLIRQTYSNQDQPKRLDSMGLSHKNLRLDLQTLILTF